jgi:hypothetical protein
MSDDDIGGLAASFCGLSHQMVGFSHSKLFQKKAQTCSADTKSSI